MFKKLNALQPISYAALRIMAGLLYFEHGTQKLLNFPIPGPGALSTLQMASGLLELIGGALIVLGLFHAGVRAHALRERYRLDPWGVVNRHRQLPREEFARVTELARRAAADAGGRFA